MLHASPGTARVTCTEVNAREPRRYLHIHPQMAYNYLRALEARELVESYTSEGPPERCGRPRYFYRLTLKGLERLKERAKCTPAPARSRR